MGESLKELYRYRALLYMIIYRDIKVRYKQSIMGVAWAILMPLLVVAAGVLVRYAYARVSQSEMTPDDIASVAVRSVPWAFIVGSIRFATASLVTNTSLVTKVYFPKEIFPLAAVFSTAFDFTVAAATLAVLLVLLGVGVSVQLLWVPVLILVLLVLLCGLSLLLSSASLFFRDVKYIVEVLLTFGIFLTPVFFSVDLVGEFRSLMLLNPAAPILEAFDAVIVQQRAPELAWLLYSFGFGALLLLAGYVSFKKLEPAFAESI